MAKSMFGPRYLQLCRVSQKKEGVTAIIENSHSHDTWLCHKVSSSKYQSISRNPDTIGFGPTNLKILSKPLNLSIHTYIHFTWGGQHFCILFLHRIRQYCKTHACFKVSSFQVNNIYNIPRFLRKITEEQQQQRIQKF